MRTTNVSNHRFEKHTMYVVPNVHELQLVLKHVTRQSERMKESTLQANMVCKDAAASRSVCEAIRLLPEVREDVDFKV